MLITVLLWFILKIPKYPYLNVNFMTNKNYFRHLCDSPLSLGDFTFHFCSTEDNIYSLYLVYYMGSPVPFCGTIQLTRRSIITNICYDSPLYCKFSPYELREWCPAIFFPYSNYLHWQKFLKIAFEIFIESNPNILK